MIKVCIIWPGRNFPVGGGGWGRYYLNNIWALEFYIKKISCPPPSHPTIGPIAPLTSHAVIKPYKTNQPYTFLSPTVLFVLPGSRNLQVVQHLLDYQIDVNKKNMLGMNALLLVAGYGNEALVEKILRAGADPNTVNDFGHT